MARVKGCIPPSDTISSTRAGSRRDLHRALAAVGDLEVEFSVDGGQTFAAAAELSVSEDGFSRPARGEDFTHIRWVLHQDIDPGAQGMAQFRARLN